VKKNQKGSITNLLEQAERKQRSSPHHDKQRSSPHHDIREQRRSQSCTPTYARRAQPIREQRRSQSCTNAPIHFERETLAAPPRYNSSEPSVERVSAESNENSKAMALEPDAEEGADKPLPDDEELQHIVYEALQMTEPPSILEYELKSRFKGTMWVGQKRATSLNKPPRSAPKLSKTLVWVQLNETRVVGYEPK